MYGMKWKRVNNPDTIIHKSIGGNFNYKIIRVARAVYEVFQEHFMWYYLTNFKSVSSARDFITKYDVNEISLTPREREPFVPTGESHVSD